VTDEPEAEKRRTNAEVRRWYLERVALIPGLNEEWVKQGLSLRERAEAAWRFRSEARLKARSMMADPIEVELLRARDMAEYGNPDGPTFEFLVGQLRRGGLKGDAVYEAVIAGSYRTNAGVDKKLSF
jgi:hypothetical protein